MRPKELVKAWVEAFNRADVSTLASFYSESAINHQVAEAPVEGRAAIRAMFSAGFASAKMVCIVPGAGHPSSWQFRNSYGGGAWESNPPMTAHAARQPF